MTPVKHEAVKPPRWALDMASTEFFHCKQGLLTLNLSPCSESIASASRIKANAELACNRCELVADAAQLPAAGAHPETEHSTRHGANEAPWTG